MLDTLELVGPKRVVKPNLYLQSKQHSPRIGIGFN